MARAKIACACFRQARETCPFARHTRLCRTFSFATFHVSATEPTSAESAAEPSTAFTATESSAAPSSEPAAEPSAARPSAAPASEPASESANSLPSTQAVPPVAASAELVPRPGCDLAASLSANRHSDWLSVLGEYDRRVTL